MTPFKYFCIKNKGVSVINIDAQVKEYRCKKNESNYEKGSLKIQNSKFKSAGTFYSTIFIPVFSKLIFRCLKRFPVVILKVFLLIPKKE